MQEISKRHANRNRRQTRSTVQYNTVKLQNHHGPWYHILIHHHTSTGHIREAKCTPIHLAPPDVPKSPAPHSLSIANPTWHPLRHAMRQVDGLGAPIPVHPVSPAGKYHRPLLLQLSYNPLSFRSILDFQQPNCTISSHGRSH